MTRRRLGMIAGGMVAAFAFATVSAMAQDQGQGRGGRGPGGDRGGADGRGPGGDRGGRGGFGGGGFGFGGGSLIDLATREAIEAELKLTDEQKAKIQQLQQESRSKRDKTMQELRDRMERNGGGDRGNRGGDRNGGDRGNRGGDRSGGTRGGGNRGASLTPGGSTGARMVLRASYEPQDGFGGYGGFGQSAGGYGDSPYVPQQQGVNPAVQREMMRQQAEQAQGQRQQAQRMQGFAAMRQGMERLAKEDEAALAKILTPPQMKRLKEISLQLEGPFAILRNQALAQKLNVTEEQYSRIQEVEQAANEQRRTAGDPMRNLFEKFRTSQPQQQDQGEGRRRGFDREAFQKFMQEPETKAVIEKSRADENARRDKNFSKVFAALDRRQASVYKAMLGDKFDTASLMRGGFGGPGGPGGQGGPGGPPPGGDTPPAQTAQNGQPAQPANTPAAKPATESQAAPAAPGSLRARRGLGSRPQ